MDKLESSTTAKNDAKPASSKPAGKAAAKASEQPGAVPATGVPVPADLIVAARLLLSEVTPALHTAVCTQLRGSMPIDAFPSHWLLMTVVYVIFM